MATVTVPVDDAVQGHLPMVCVRTGQPTTTSIGIDQPVSQVSWWIVALVFLGPPGWLALLVVTLLDTHRGILRMRLPMAREAWIADLRWRAVRAAAAISALAAMVNVVAELWPHRSASLAAAVFASVIFAASHLLLAFRLIRVRMDASRRWVTLSGVHAGFASAVEHRSIPSGL